MPWQPGWPTISWGALVPSTARQGSSHPTLLCAVPPHLGHWVQVLVPQRKNIKLLESPKEGTKMGKGLSAVCEELLRTLGLLSPEPRS